MITMAMITNDPHLGDDDIVGDVALLHQLSLSVWAAPSCIFILRIIIISCILYLLPDGDNVEILDGRKVNNHYQSS